MTLPEKNSGTLSDLFVQIKSEKVAQNCWPFLAQFNWPLTPPVYPSEPVDKQVLQNHYFGYRHAI
jgi:hypothetical protein